MPRLVRTPHDLLFKWVFGRPAAIAVLLRRTLPAALVRALDWPSLEVRPASFVDPRLSPRHVDLLVTIRFLGGPQILYVIVEHQSSAERLMPSRLLRYVGRTHERYIASQRAAVRVLPLVVPVVVHQGPGPWPYPRRLSAVLDVPPALRGLYDGHVELRFEVDELEGSVLGDPLAPGGVAELVEVTRTLMRLAARPHEIMRSTVEPLAPLLDRIMDELGLDDVRALWTYVINAFPHDSPLRAILIAAASPTMQQTFVSIYDEAFLKGTAEGRAEGQAELLLRLLDRRGLAVSAPQRERVLACRDRDQLQRWFDRAITAEHLREVFDPAPSAE